MLDAFSFVKMQCTSAIVLVFVKSLRLSQVFTSKAPHGIHGCDCTLYQQKMISLRSSGQHTIHWNVSHCTEWEALCYLAQCPWAILIVVDI